MNLLKKVSVFLLFILLLTSCTINKTPATIKTKSSEAAKNSIKKDISKPEKTYTYTFNESYIYWGYPTGGPLVEFDDLSKTMEELYDRSELVCEFTVKEKSAYHDGDDWIISSKLIPEIKQVFKGEYIPDKTIHMLGGTMSYEEYERVVPEGTKHLIAENTTQPKYVHYTFRGMHVPEIGETVMAFLSYDSKMDSYNIVDAYQGIFREHGDFIDNCTIVLSPLSEDILLKCSDEGGMAIKDYSILEQEDPKMGLTSKNTNEIEKMPKKDIILKESDLIALDKFNIDDGMYISNGIDLNAFKKAIERLK